MGGAGIARSPGAGHRSGPPEMTEIRRGTDGSRGFNQDGFPFRGDRCGYRGLVGRLLPSIGALWGNAPVAHGSGPGPGAHSAGRADTGSTRSGRPARGATHRIRTSTNAPTRVHRPRAVPPGLPECCLEGQALLGGPLFPPIGRVGAAIAALAQVPPSPHSPCFCPSAVAHPGPAARSRGSPSAIDRCWSVVGDLLIVPWDHRCFTEVPIPLRVKLG